MQNLTINGTSLELFNFWITFLNNAIETNNLYEEGGNNNKFRHMRTENIDRLNKLRDVIPLNDASEGRSSKHWTIETHTSNVKAETEKVKNYLEAVKNMITIPE